MKYEALRRIKHKVGKEMPLPIKPKTGKVRKLEKEISKPLCFVDGAKCTGKFTLGVPSCEGSAFIGEDGKTVYRCPRLKYLSC